MRHSFYVLLMANLCGCTLLLTRPGALECDAGTAARCDGNTLVVCVNGVEFHQDCGQDSCSAAQGGSCEGPASCGNGTVEAGEQCDDGNNISTDSCVSCQNARCGDGFTRSGVEQCDDSNTQNGDGCSSACQIEGGGNCGDGTINAGEQCDDANNVSTDSCVSCQNARCGDGFTRSGVEQCDDSNTQNGDGCSSTCQTEGTAAGTCASPQLASIGSQSGDTTGQQSVLQSTCTGATAPEVVFRFTPSTSGTLDITLQTPLTDQGFYVRTNCQNGPDLTCVDAVGTGGNEAGSVSVTAGAPIFIIVDGFNDPSQAGPFTLTLSQGGAGNCGNGTINAGEQCDDANNINTDSCVACQNAFCGDGFTRSGFEQCDDGNTQNGDGCSSTCQTEAAAGGTCQSPIITSIGTTNGDTTGTTNVVAGSCQASIQAGGGTGGDTVFRFTASSAGTRTFTLTSTGANGDHGIILYSANNCGSATELGCVDANFGQGEVETLTQSMTANQTIFIMISAFAPGSQGPFTLTIQ